MHRRLYLLLAFLAVIPTILGGFVLSAPKAEAAAFIAPCGTHLCQNGAQWRFDGFNMYYLNGCGPVYNASAVNASLSDMRGGEVIRSWFFEHEISGSGAINWAPFDRTLSLAASHGFKVIVTLDNQWGDCVASGYKHLSWYQSGYKSRDGDGPLSYRDFVRKVVARYVNHPEILAWQLMNEAEDKNSNGTCSETSAANSLRAFTSDMAGLIHSIDHHHMVNLGTMGSGQCGTAGSDYKYVNSAPGNNLCEYHDYGSPLSPMPGDQWNGLKVRLGQCAALGKPLFVGETGILASSVGGYANRASDFDKKFGAQYRAGVTGELVWSWRLAGSTSGWDVGPSDPTTALLRKY